MALNRFLQKYFNNRDYMKAFFVLNMKACLLLVRRFPSIDNMLKE